jgi:pilus assembly protein Flp/PilA
MSASDQETRRMRIAFELFRDRTGATAIEYGLITALIGATIIFALSATGSEIGNTMNVAQNGMATGNSGA